MRRNDNTVQISSSLIPEPDEAVQLFESKGGHITLFSPFGRDPLETRPDLYSQRNLKFIERYSDFQPFFHTVVNGDYSLFREGLLYFISVSKQYESLL